VPKFFGQNLQSQIVGRKKIQKTFLIKKAAGKMLVKLTLLVNVTNILGANFCASILSTKKLQCQTVGRKKLQKTLNIIRKSCS